MDKCVILKELAELKMTLDLLPRDNLCYVYHQYYAYQRIYVSRIFLTRRLSAVGLRHIVTERFNQINIIVTNDCILIKKKKGDLK
jgi:hypothetical protein